MRKFDIKTQTFQEVAYGGYKANRAEMPADLAQQLPYIRRATDSGQLTTASHQCPVIAVIRPRNLELRNDSVA